ncbi:MAG: Trypsin, partial [Jatrophihabitans sp.]|nr:Trypsin [Jatrophihabitans sp.]
MVQVDGTGGSTPQAVRPAPLLPRSVPVRREEPQLPSPMAPSSLIMTDRSRRRRVRIAALSALLLAGGAATVSPLPAAAVAPRAITPPVARPVTSIPTVGPLFFPSLLGLGPTLGLPHYCSASVVRSAGHDLVLTAAHCVYGTGLATEFAPGFHDGVSPYGVWAVRRA